MMALPLHARCELVVDRRGDTERLLPRAGHAINAVTDDLHRGDARGAEDGTVEGRWAARGRQPVLVRYLVLELGDAREDQEDVVLDAAANGDGDGADVGRGDAVLEHCPDELLLELSLPAIRWLSEATDASG